MGDRVNETVVLLVAANSRTRKMVFRTRPAMITRKSMPPKKKLQAFAPVTG